MVFGLFLIFIVNDASIIFVVHIYVIVHWFEDSIEINSLWNYWVKRFVHSKLTNTTIWLSKMAYKTCRFYQQWLRVPSCPYSHQQRILSLNYQMKIDLICISLITGEALPLIRCVLSFFIPCLSMKYFSTTFFFFSIVKFILGICKNSFCIVDTVLHPAPL